MKKVLFSVALMGISFFCGTIFSSYVFLGADDRYVVMYEASKVSRAIDNLENLHSNDLTKIQEDNLKIATSGLSTLSALEEALEEKHLKPGIDKLMSEVVQYHTKHGLDLAANDPDGRIEYILGKYKK